VLTTWPATDPLYLMLADGSTGTPDDATYAYSPDNPTLPMRVKMGPLNYPGVDTGHIVSARVECLQQDTTFLFSLYFGATLCAQWSQLVNADQAAQTVAHTLTSAEADALIAAMVTAGATNYNDVELEILASQ